MSEPMSEERLKASRFLAKSLEDDAWFKEARLVRELVAEVRWLRSTEVHKFFEQVQAENERLLLVEKHVDENTLSHLRHMQMVRLADRYAESKSPLEQRVNMVIDSLRAENATLRECCKALLPFAELADEGNLDPDDDMVVGRLSDCKTARDAAREAGVME